MAEYRKVHKLVEYIDSVNSQAIDDPVKGVVLDNLPEGVECAEKTECIREFSRDNALDRSKAVEIFKTAEALGYIRTVDLNNRSNQSNSLASRYLRLAMPRDERIIVTGDGHIFIYRRWGFIPTGLFRAVTRDNSIFVGFIFGLITAAVAQLIAWAIS